MEPGITRSTNVGASADGGNSYAWHRPQRAGAVSPPYGQKSPRVDGAAPRRHATFRRIWCCRWWPPPERHCEVPPTDRYRPWL